MPEPAAEIRRRLGPSPELPEWPLVSIVVLNRNGVDHLRRLLTGLIECTDYPALELILVDNCSSDGSLDYMCTVEAPFPISILANHHNESFSDANNQGAELAAGELLLFLNNDTEPFEPGWLRELVACRRESGAGAVAPTLIQADPDGRSASGYAVQQRGLVTRTRHGGRTLTSGFRDHLADPLGGTLGADVDSLAVAAACMLIPRDAFESVGGFSHGYLYGGEDVDLSFKLRSAGLRVICSGRSLLIHAQSSIWETAGSDQIREWARGNRRVFLEHWGPRARREFELARADGSAASRAEAEALAYCLEAGDPPGEADERTRELLEALHRVLRDRGHRCLVASGGENDDLRTLECDVAVHFRGRARHAPRPGQLSVLWSVGELDGLSAIECSHYDLVVCGSPEQAECLQRSGLSTPVTVISGPGGVAALPATVETRAREVGYRTTIG